VQTIVLYLINKLCIKFNPKSIKEQPVLRANQNKLLCNTTYNKIQELKNMDSF
jgi:hypothetical protein